MRSSSSPPATGSVEHETEHDDDEEGERTRPDASRWVLLMSHDRTRLDCSSRALHDVPGSRTLRERRGLDDEVGETLLPLSVEDGERCEVGQLYDIELVNPNELSDEVGELLWLAVQDSSLLDLEDALRTSSSVGESEQRREASCFCIWSELGCERQRPSHFDICDCRNWWKFHLVSGHEISLSMVTKLDAESMQLSIPKPETLTGYLIGRNDKTIKLDLGPDAEPVTIEISDPKLFVRCLRNDIVSCETRPIASPVPVTTNEEARTSQQSVLTLVGATLITRSLVEEKHTIAAMIASVRWKGKLLVIPAKLARLHRHIEENWLSAQLPTVSQFLSYKANLHNSSASKAVLRSMPFSLLDSSELAAILRGWYRENDVRLLECIGVDKEKLRECYFRADVLYNLYMENPMLVYCIPLEQAFPASRLLGITVAEYRAAAIALRALADETVLKWGHCCVDCNSFYKKHKLPRVSIDQLLERAVTGETCDGKGVLYLTEVREMEVYVAARFAEIMKGDLPAIGGKREAGRGQGMVDDREQDKAVEMALKHNISIVNGAAGTGKTTIVRRIIACLRLNGVSFACTSFTGCATARISECCGVEAEDMDLMIVKSDDYTFSHLIIDEFSMVSLRLIYSFLQAFPDRFRITIIGDVNQLEPIGPGSILKQLIKSHCIPVTTLRTIHRVKTKDGVVDKIIENSKRIAYWEKKPFSFIQGDNFTVRDGTIGTVTAEIVDMHKRGVALDRFVFISPWKLPIPLINRAVQAQYNSQNKCCVRRAGKWTVHSHGPRNLDTTNPIYHVGDRVMILKNKGGGRKRDTMAETQTDGQARMEAADDDEPETEIGVQVAETQLVSGEDAKLFNGQDGVIVDISNRGIEVDVRRTGRILFPYMAGRRDDADESEESDPRSETGKSIDVSFFTLSYAVTVHKMQGKQCQLVIYFIGQDWSSFLTRNMTYTAITRAEEEVLAIGNPQNFNKSINNVPKDKNEYLYWRLRELLPQDFDPEKDDRMRLEIEERMYRNSLLDAADAGSDDDEGYRSDPGEDD